MRSLVWLVFFLFIVCGLLGFSLAQSDLFNPTTSAAEAERLLLQADVEYQMLLATARLDEKRLAAELEAELYRAKALTGMLFLLSAVAAACLVAVTCAIVYWMLQRANRRPLDGRDP